MIHEPEVSLSEEQQAAVAHDHLLPAIVDAGAGTGKTFTIVERVAALCAGGKLMPSQILLLTFGKKAAGELQRRLVQRLGPQLEPPPVATFHAFALGVLRQYAYDLTISPDLNLINEVDARLEFALAFGELERGELPEDASNFCLRFPLRDEVRESLFLIVQKLKDTGASIEAFRRRALRAADDFARVPYRKIVQIGKRVVNVIAEVSDAEFDDQIKAEGARVEAACALFQRFDQRLALRGALTYADLLLLAENALREKPSIAADLRRRFKHCIVDEFQDTDPRQDSLLEAIFDGFAGVMAVGDPRQSIYGFRGADPHNFEVFRRSYRCVDHALSENRRSRQEILDLAHHIISVHSDDASPLRAARGSAHAQVVHVSAGFFWPGSPAPNAEESRKREGAAVARRIAWILQSGRSVEESGRRVPLGPRHIAILSRNKTKIQPYTDALLELGIPYRLFGGVGFYDAPEVMDALSWMKLLADPFDSIPLARAAASPGIGISDATLSELNPVRASDTQRGDHDADVFARRLLVDPLADGLNAQGHERIQRLRETLEALESYAGAPVGLAYEAMLERSGLARAAAASGVRDAAQALANLRKLGGLARTFGLRNPGARPADFVGYIYALEQSMEDDREADPPSADALSVMTIHAAKGLEWPIVFIVDVWPRGQHDKLPVRVDEQTGAMIVSEGGDGVRPFHTHALQEDADSQGHTLPKKDRAKDDGREREERRLYYVALTRARDELFISGKRTPPSKTNPAGKPDEFLAEAISWMETRGWPVDEPLPSLPLTGDEAFPQAPPAMAGSDSARTDAGCETALSAQPNGAVTPALRPAAKFRVPTLSFTLMARFERCARQVNYELALG
ncbi:MAG: ATP-dependent helicase, partial [Candidatus Eremiobacteraeota bacterium]|nr:ATP-dependent helicase [Candidatus Eremiobacteraeota bacterium]